MRLISKLTNSAMLSVMAFYVIALESNGLQIEGVVSEAVNSMSTASAQNEPIYVQKEDVFGRLNSYEISAPAKPFGMKHDLSSGVVSFEIIDVAIPGNFKIPVEIRRVLSTGGSGVNALPDFKNWSLDIPRIYSTSVGRSYDGGQTILQGSGWRMGTACTDPAGEIEFGDGTKDFTKMSERAYFSGATLVIPGKVNEKILRTNSSEIEYKTVGNYKIKCIAGNDDGFEVLSPDGLTYTFDQRTRKIRSLQQSNSVYTYLELALVTQISDRFNNSVTYHYDDTGGLYSITSTDGREITINRSGGYSESVVPDFQGGTIDSIVVNNRTWDYDYSGNNDSYLSTVTLPDQTTWEYSESVRSYPVRSRQHGDGIDEEQLICYLAPNIDETSLQITNPSGAQATLTLSATYQGRAGVFRSNVDHTYTNSNLNPGLVKTYILNPKCSGVMALTQKHILLRDHSSYQTDYIYSQNPGYFSIEDIPEVNYSVDVPPSLDTAEQRAQHKYVVESKPDGSKSVYFFNQEQDSFYENKLVVQDDYDIDGTTLLKRTSHDYVQGVRVGSSHVFDNVKGINYRVNESLLTTKLFHDDGNDEYYTENQEWDEFGFTTLTLEHNDFSQRKKYVRYGYNHYINDNWLIGIPTTTEASGDGIDFENISELTYKTEFPFHLNEVKVSGVWQHRYEQYHDNGLPEEIIYNAVLRNSSANNTESLRFKRLLNYKRGIPQTIVLPNRYSDSGTIQSSQTVDDNGWVTSKTNLNNITAYYKFNNVGRLTAIDLPGSWKDQYLDWKSNVYNDLQVDVKYCDLNIERDGCNAGSVVLTKTVSFDSLLRKVQIQTYEFEAESRYLNYQYNFSNSPLFISYQSDNSNESQGQNIAYDGLGRQVSSSFSGGGTATTSYKNTNTLLTVDAESNRQITRYLAYGQPSYQQPLQISSPSDVGTTTTFGVNIFGDVDWIQQTDSNDVSNEALSLTEYRYYDAQHRVCKVTRSDIGATYYSYNAIGELGQVKTGIPHSAIAGCSYSGALESQTVLTYDNLGAEWKISYDGGSGFTAPSKVYSRDKLGNVKSIETGAVKHVYNYNSLNLLDDETLYINNVAKVPGAGGVSIDYGYDELGNLSSVSYPDGDSISYSPNSFGEPTVVKRERDGETDYNYASEVEYYASGLLKTFEYGNGIVHETVPNIRNVPQILSDNLSGHNILELTYSYDNNLNITSVIDSVTPVFSLTELEYDGLDRLTATEDYDGNVSSSIGYDALGNITSYNTPERSLTYNYEAFTGDPRDNLLRAVDHVNNSTTYKSFSYDMRGNVINDSLHSFVYNRANQLVEATGAASTNSYLYDGHNRRVQTDDTNGTSISIYDSNGKLRYVETNGQVVNYVYLGDRLIAKDGFVTDRKPVQHFRPYGASVEGEINDVGFTGHKFDTSLGLSYMQARYYDPVIGRFYSNDPIGFRDVHSFNRYAYANNNPYKYVDPTGESAVGALTTFIAADAATPEPTDAAIIPKALGYTILLGGAIAIDAVFNESPDDIVVDVLDGKVPTGKPGEYIGDPADLESDLEALTGGDTKQYPNGTRVGQMEDGSTVEQHGSSGKGSDGNKGANVSKGTPTIKVNRPPGTRNITIRYPEIKQESQ